MLKGQRQGAPGFPIATRVMMSGAPKVAKSAPAPHCTPKLAPMPDSRTREPVGSACAPPQACRLANPRYRIGLRTVIEVALPQRRQGAAQVEPSVLLWQTNPSTVIPAARHSQPNTSPMLS
jgi:hypothetical protein